MRQLLRGCTYHGETPHAFPAYWSRGRHRSCYTTTPCRYAPSKHKRWVKGHADATKTIHTLNQSQRMNVDMDGAAASCRRHDIATPQRHYPGSKAMLSLADQWVTTAYRQRI